VPNRASDRLKRMNAEIMHTWENRAVEEVEAALHKNSLALRDSLPEFLDQVADALNTTTERSMVRIRWDREESTRVGKKHGRERAATLNYTMDQLIFEYHILRQVICDTMEQEAPLSRVEREVIVCAVEQAVNDAATEFSSTLSDIKEKFTNTLAHDIRGPLSTVIMGAQLIIDSPQTPKEPTGIATRISRAAERIDLMIHDLLDGSRLRAGEKLKLEFAECDLNLIVQQIVDETNLSNRDRIKYQPTGAVKGQWNENGLRRVIDNLVINAVKFSTPDSPITLALTEVGNSAEVSVHNEGAPIPAEEKSILFQQFRRARNSAGKTGWGLGLTVVKGIAEAHGGRVEVDSAAGIGTSFRVVLPRDLSRQRSSTLPASSVAAAPRAKPASL
jgi:signal transduction histidine kinase